MEIEIHPFSPTHAKMEEVGIVFSSTRSYINIFITVDAFAHHIPGFFTNICDMERTDEFISIANLFATHSAAVPADAGGGNGGIKSGGSDHMASGSNGGSAAVLTTLEEYVRSIPRPPLSRALVESIQLRVMLDQNEAALAKIQKL
jgi:hypothetical protein